MDLLTPARCHRGRTGTRNRWFALLNRNGTIAMLYVAPEAQFTGVSKVTLAVLEEHAVAPA